jgi:hypothetical protein
VSVEKKGKVSSSSVNFPYPFDDDDIECSILDLDKADVGIKVIEGKTRISDGINPVRPWDSICGGNQAYAYLSRAM